jgi:predicted Zn-dependent protease
MDRLDKLTIEGIVFFVCAAIWMIGNAEVLKRRQEIIDQKAGEVIDPFAAQMARDKEIYQDIETAIQQKQFEEGMKKLQDIMQQHPDNPMSYVYMARLLLNQGQLREAVHSYRDAIDKNPDYIDNHTPIFIGKEINDVVEEGRVKFGREQKLKPNDTQIKEALKEVYYLQRRLLGGCE